MEMLATALVFFVCFRLFDRAWAYAKAWWAVYRQSQSLETRLAAIQAEYAQLGLIKAWTDAHSGSKPHQPS